MTIYNLHNEIQIMAYYCNFVSNYSLLNEIKFIDLYYLLIPILLANTYITC